MKPLMLCLAVLLACALPCAAQISIAPFADPAPIVPLNTWPWAAAAAIEKAGIPLSHPEGTYGGKREMTRSVFAVATGNLLVNLNLLPASPLVPDSGFRGNYTEPLRRNPPALNALLALTKEFAPELGRLGWDVPKATARLDALQEQQRQDVRVGKIVLTPEQWKSPFADVPRTATAWRLSDTITKAGIVGVGMLPMNEWPSSTIGILPLTRLQMAQSLVRLVTNTVNAPNLSKRLQQNPSAMIALNALSVEFRPELSLLGMSVSVYDDHIADLEHHQPLPLTDAYFTDVPANHWAGQAVETLRQQGIMEGYPGGGYTTR